MDTVVLSLTAVLTVLVDEAVGDDDVGVRFLFYFICWIIKGCVHKRLSRGRGIIVNSS